MIKLIIFLFYIFILALAKSPSKIINGESVAEGEFPSQVIIYFRGQVKCTGTIVDEIHIITGANCVFYANKSMPANDFTVQSGITQWSPWQSLIYDVKNIHLHNKFISNGTYINDIAIITLYSNIKFSSFRQPAKLPINDLSDGTSVIVTGMKNIQHSFDPENFSIQIKKLQTIVISNSECEKLLKRTIDHQQFCVKGDSSICDGDIGSSLFYGDTLVGIASFGIPCTEKNTPTIFTRINYFLPWINDVLASIEDMQ